MPICVLKNSKQIKYTLNTYKNWHGNFYPDGVLDELSGHIMRNYKNGYQEMNRIFNPVDVWLNIDEPDRIMYLNNRKFKFKDISHFIVNNKTISKTISVTKR